MCSLLPIEEGGERVNVSVYEVGPRDGLQYLKHIVPSEKKRELIESLYSAGVENIEEVSFAHPKVLPQMADAEDVFSGKGAALVMNKRGFDRAVEAGVEKINIVFSPCDIFNLKNMGKTRSEIITMYYTFLNGYPKENVRVYISMAFGSPDMGDVSHRMMLSCIKDAKLFSNNVVICDTIGCGMESEVKLWAEVGNIEGVTLAMHLHHKGDEHHAMRLVRSGLLNGIKQFDASIGGLGGCPFTNGSGANINTATLVRYLHAWGFETGIDEEKLEHADWIAKRIGAFFNYDAMPLA